MHTHLIHTNAQTQLEQTKTALNNIERQKNEANQPYQEQASSSNKPTAAGLLSSAVKTLQGLNVNGANSNGQNRDQNSKEKSLQQGSKDRLEDIQKIIETMNADLHSKLRTIEGTYACALTVYMCAYFQVHAHPLCIPDVPP